MKIQIKKYIYPQIILAFILLNTGFVFADTVSTKTRTVTKIVEGVYVIRHKDAPDDFPQGNTTIIIGDKSILVVDSCYLPSSAREDIAEIRKWTNKPVRYLVNTHWHYDHTMGNGTYAEAFPNLDIIAHFETAKQNIGYNPGWFERYLNRVNQAKKVVETGKTADGKQLTESEKAESKNALEKILSVQKEFEKIVDKSPNITFDHQLNLNLGNRQVELKYLGRANTNGDALIYLPKEKILISGDLVVHPVPYLFGGYPSEFHKTLREVNRLDFQILVPGHGEILREKYATNYINQVADLVELFSTEVSKEVHRIGGGTGNLEPVSASVKKKLDVNTWRRKFAADDKEAQEQFDNSFEALLKYSFLEILGR